MLKNLVIVFMLVSLPFLLPEKAQALTQTLPVENCGGSYNRPAYTQIKVTYPTEALTEQDIPITMDFTANSDFSSEYYVQLTNEKAVKATTYSSSGKKIGKDDLNKPFILKASQAGQYHILLRIWDPLNGNPRICSAHTIDIYDSKLSQVTCSVSIPQNVIPGESVNIKAKVNDVAGVNYNLYVFSPQEDIQTSLKDAAPPANVVNMYFKQERIRNSPPDIVDPNNGTGMSRGNLQMPPDDGYQAAILAYTYTGGLPYSFYCAKVKFNVTGEAGKDTSYKSSEPLIAPGGEIKGLAAGQEICTVDADPPIFTPNQPIRVKADNLTDTNSDISAVIKDDKGNLVKAAGPKKAGGSGFVSFEFSSTSSTSTDDGGSLISELPTDKDYTVEFYNANHEQLCKNSKVAFTLKQSEPPREPTYDENGNLIAKCSVRTGLQTDSVIDLQTEGLEQNKIYHSYLTRIKDKSILTGESKNSDSNGRASFVLRSGAVLEEGDYLASLNDANNKNVCSTDKITITKSSRQQATESAKFRGKSCVGKECAQSAGRACFASGEDTGKGPDGILTAIGCIPTQPSQLFKAALKVSAGAGGGIALLLMIFGAIRMMTSAGNPEVVKKGQEQFQSAVIGLLFIIFSVLLLQIIGVDVLNLPGFG